jgi:transcriptional regulator with XRE-family HTH domain
VPSSSLPETTLELPAVNYGESTITRSSISLEEGIEASGRARTQLHSQRKRCRTAWSWWPTWPVNLDPYDIKDIIRIVVCFRGVGMSISPLQLRLARAALSWSVRMLASKAGVSPDSIVRAERDGMDVTRKTLSAIQQALEEAGIEFLPEINSVSLHIDPAEAVIRADPAMPLGVRRIYPRNASEETGRYRVSIVRLPLPRHPMNEIRPEGRPIKRIHAVETEAAALALARELVQAGYGIEVTGPNLRWDRTEVMRKLNESLPG